MAQALGRTGKYQTLSKTCHKLAIFDYDSTLMNGESINRVLEQIVTDKKQQQALEEIRAKGMRGEVSLQSSLSQRIAFFRGLNPQRLEQICQQFRWNRGAKQTIAELKKRGYLTVCLSASFRIATRRVMTDLGIDAYAANTLEINKGIFTGIIKGDLLHHDSKGKLLKKIQTELGVAPENTLVVGDGANDLSLFDYAHTRIAFCAEEILQSRATHIIKHKNLLEVLRCI